MKNDYNVLNNLLKNKKVLYIPIYSCFSYQNQRLNFKADGNINRFLSTFYHVNDYASLDIVCPQNGNDFDWFEKSVNDLLGNKTNLIKTDLIIKSAKIERSIKFANNLYNFLVNKDDYDFIICEAQHLYMKFYDNYKDKLIYWCPVCATNDKTRDFLEPFKEYDKYILSISKYSIIASIDQLNYVMSLPYHGQVMQIESLIDRELSIFDYKKDENTINLINNFNNKKIVYLPFRLTDLGYKTQEIVDYLYNNHKYDVEVLFSNPNDCDYLKFAQDDEEKKSWMKEKFHLVSKNREVFYTIIDYGNVIIPYFEDIDFIMHASYIEFMYGNCKVARTLEDFNNILNS